MRLIYVPLEQYKERYTEYLSGPNGMFERQAKELGVEVVAIRPHDRIHTISTGVVLDPIARCTWAFEQTQQLVQMIVSGFISPQDVIYFEDFWHPGMEMIPYAKSLVGREQIKLYTFNHAQSVDSNDFTYAMRGWMRPFETAWANALSGVFCAASELVEMMMWGWWNIGKHTVTQLPTQLHDTGTVFDHRVLYDIAGLPYDWDPRDPERLQTVVFSSRWDKEKHPEIFCQLAEAVIQEREDVNFVVCTSAAELRSNSPELLVMAHAMEKKYPTRFSINTGLTKKSYYGELMSASVQFNSADQDFVSYTLLEAAAFGCAPLYPDYLTFPNALHGHKLHLYKKNNIFDAKMHLYALLGSPLRSYEWVYAKYEKSVHRMLYKMGFDVPAPKSLTEWINDGRSEAAKEMFE